MTNRWIEFVKDFANRNNLSYGCALGNPKLKEEYRIKYGSSKKISAKKEKEAMSMEDINISLKSKYLDEMNNLRNKIINSKTKEEIKKNLKTLNKFNNLYSEGELTTEEESNLENIVEIYNKSYKTFNKK